MGVVIAALLCASSVDARALRAELDVGVTDVVATEESNEPIARARDKVLADADEAGPSSTTDAAAAVETRTSPTSSSDDDDDVLSTGITKGLVRRTAVDGVVFVTWANNHYKDFARFWTMRLKSLGLTNFMVGAMDDELYRYMTEMGVATWHMGSKGIEKDAVKKDFGWGSQNFHKMGRDKIRLIRDFTKVEGISVLISDIDVAWLRDPTPFFKRYPSADILVSTDLLRSEIALDPPLQTPHLVDGEGLEFHVCHAASNIGIMWFRPTRGSQQLTEEWVRRIEADDKLWDQNAFNDLKALAGACAYRPDGTGLTDTAFGGRVTMGTLPVSQFSNGHTFYAQRLHTQVGLEPYAVHNTFQFGGTPGKRHRAREANAWLGDEEINYFDGDPELPEKGMFMSYTPRIPSAEAVNLTMFAERSWPEAKDDTFPAIETVDEEIVRKNKELVSFQIKQIKTAAAIAQKLGRTLVLPRSCAAWTACGSRTTAGSRDPRSRCRSCAQWTTSSTWTWPTRPNSASGRFTRTRSFRRRCASRSPRSRSRRPTRTTPCRDRSRTRRSTASAVRERAVTHRAVTHRAVTHRGSGVARGADVRVVGCGAERVDRQAPGERPGGVHATRRHLQRARGRAHVADTPPGHRRAVHAGRIGALGGVAEAVRRAGEDVPAGRVVLLQGGAREVRGVSGGDSFINVERFGTHE